ncbi:ankyrin repeat-containing domain protein [Parasitella parasitica]|nr:ankyrin repeat-containing domain protein [Parasitella parasitica]
MKAPTSQDNIWIAAGDGQVDRVRELLENGVEAGAHDEFGYTAMHAAVSYNQIEMVKFLIDSNVNVDIEDFEKDTPLYVAENVEMAQLLLDNGADPKHTNEDGITPAMAAYEEGWEEVAQLLASITKEVLPSKEQEIDPLAYIEQEDDEAIATATEVEVETIAQTTQPDSNIQDQDEMSEELSSKMQNIMKHIEEQGGVADEDELRELVAKMLLDEMQQKLDK